MTFCLSVNIIWFSWVAKYTKKCLSYSIVSYLWGNSIGEVLLNKEMTKRAELKKKFFVYVFSKYILPTFIIYISFWIHMWTVVNTICIDPFRYTHVITSTKVWLKQTWRLAKTIAERKCDTGQTMKLEWRFSGLRFKFRSGQLSLATSKRILQYWIYIYIYVCLCVCMCVKRANHLTIRLLQFERNYCVIFE